MRIRLLGDIAVAPDGVESSPGDGWSVIVSPRSQCVLAMLALRAGVVTTDAMAEALWSGDLPVHWKPALRNAVAKLRRELDAVGHPGGSIVETTPTGYRLGRGQHLDVHDAIADVKAAVDALGAGDADRALELAAPAASVLGRGLAPALDADWLLADRTRVANAEMRALEAAATASVRTGRPADAVGFATRAIERDPLREEAHRQLIGAHLAAGSRAEALRSYERCRRTLADELGVPPDDRTADLYRRALGSESPSERAVRGRHETPFTGRVRELAALTERIASSTVIELVGPAGIGKSRLADEAAASSRERFAGGRWRVDLEDVDDDSALGAIAGALGVELAADADAASVCGMLAARGPTLLVLDGVDRCADAVAALAAALSTRAPDVAVIVTSRRPVGAPGATVVKVAGLDPVTDAVHCFVAHARHAGIELPDGDDATTEIVELSRLVDGNPLALALLARQAGVTSLRDLVDDAARDPGTTPLSAVIRSSVGLLDHDERHVFARLAIVGGAANLALVQAVAADGNLPAGRVTRILSQLAERGLVQLDRGEVHWRYDVHPTLRRAGRDLLGADGPDAYGRLADAVFTMLPGHATHPPDVSGTRVLLSAIRGLFEAALAGKADADRALRLAFWLHRYWAADGVDQGIYWTTRLLDAAGPRAPHRGSASFGLGYLLIWAGRPAAASVHLAVACDELGRADDVMVAAAHYYLASTYENRQPDAARRHYQAAIDAAIRHGDEMLATVCAEGLGTVECDEGDFDAGLARYEASMAARYSRGGDELLKAGMGEFARMLMTAGRLDDAERALGRGEALLGDEPRIANIITSATRARLDRVRGRPRSARRAAMRAVEMVASTGVRRLEALPHVTLALLEVDEGDAVSAASRLAAAAKSSAETDQPHLLADVLDAAAIVACRAGAGEQAARLAGASDGLRERAFVVRPRPEQGELDEAAAALAFPGWRTVRRAGAAIETAAVVDLVVELAGTDLTAVAIRARQRGVRGCR